MRRTLLLLAMLLVIPGLAQAQEYRTIRLTDGRVLKVEVLESTASGMRIRTPQGRMMVDYSALAGMDDLAEMVFRGQEPMRIGLAPVSWSDASLDEVAWQVDPWLARAVKVVPEAMVLPSAAWGAAMGRSPADLEACRADVDCMLGDGPVFGLDVLVVPRVEPGERPTLVLEGFVAGSRKLMGRASATLTVVGGTVDPGASGRAAARAVFAALGLQPDIDVDAAAALHLPAPGSAGPPASVDASVPAPTVAPSAPSAPVGTRVGGAVADANTPDDSDEPDADIEAATGSEPLPVPAGFGPRPTLRKALLLGAVPLPGLSSIYLQDPLGAIASIAGTVGLSWASIYGIGAGARSPGAFWGPSLLTPYAISTAFNEVSAVVGWQRLHKPRPTVQAPRLRPMVAVAPTLGREGNPSGVWLNVTLVAD
jgi:hypothetical protein